MSFMNQKCKYCKHERGEHKARTLHCPIGGGNGMVGHVHYHSSQVFEARAERKRKEEKESFVL